MATSLVERSLPGLNNSVTAFALSPTDPETIHLASSNRIQCWDWTTGAVVDEPIKYKGKIHAMCAATAGDKSEDLLYTICQSEGEWQILAGDRVIYTSQLPLSHLSVEAQYIMAASATHLVVGRRSSPKPESDEETHFTFIEIASPIEITCAAGKAQVIEASKKKSGPSHILTVAAGNVEGQIMVYEDVFSATKPPGQSLMPRTLHWHREAVASLKWSLDANYLVSGGRETTLVLWQLATGKTQFLPHLTAEIERLTVSPSGTSYAIQLADNSVMVLSTTELKPIANFAGLQAQTVIGSDTNKYVKPSAAALHPARRDQILLAVPPSQATSSRPFLQTYDITNDRHVSRQALTRNNVTDFNKGPEGNKIEVPDVSFIKLSVDGQWLATAEEWSPPSTDLDFISSRTDIDHQRNLRREVYLKIWQWDEDRSLWTLETRIDNPHQISEGDQPARVLGLASDPVENGFATIGEDSCVRIWKPKTRLRNGLVIRGANSEGLIDWSCRHTIQLDHKVELTEEEQSPSLSSRPKSAAIAYSEDASMLAASQVFEDSSIPAVVSFINTASGTIEQTRSGLFTGNLKALDFLDRHLLLVSDTTINVWDVVDESLKYRTSLTANASSTAMLMAVSHEDRTFALSLSSPISSRISIFNTSSPKPELATKMHKSVSALLTVAGRKGYTIVTTDAEVRTLLPKTSAAKLTSGTSASTAVAVVPEVEDVEIEEDTDMDMEERKPMFAIDDEEADKPVVRPEELARVFEAENVALMPVRDMFNAVVGLYSRKPRATVVAA